MGQILFSQPGAPAVEALRTLLHEVRGGDRLAPVDVIVPTGFAEVTVRRAVAGEAGLANVRFSALPQVAERLAARHLALSGQSVSRPLTAAVRSQATRATVANAHGALAQAAKHRTTLGLLESLMGELDEARLDLSVVDREALSTHGVEVLDLFTDYRSRVGHLVTPAEMLLSAIEAIEKGDAPETHVVLYCPSRLTAPAKDFLRSLHHLGRLSAVIAGSPDETTAWVSEVLGHLPVHQGQPAYPEMHLTVAPDAEEEVALVVRQVLAQLAATSCRPERIGIAYRAATPYARLLSEQLRVAGVPFHVPSQRTLDQTIAGRVALGLIELQLHDFPRADVIRWLSDGPLVDADGRRLPADRWDRLSREAGVARGAATWADRLELYASEQDRRATDLTPADTEAVARLQGRAAATRALAAFVASAATASEQVISAPTWSGVAESLAAALKLVLGKRTKVDAWSSSDPLRAHDVALEQSSYDAVLASVAALAELDESVGGPTPSTIADALRGELDRSVSSGTTLGRGVLVGPFSQFVGSDVDLLCVVGMTEDSFPARTREHPILRDADRTRISGELRTVAARRGDERESWLAVLHSSRSIELAYPRADTRSQRRQFAAPWFLEQATRLNSGDLVGASQVDGLERSWLKAYPSFVASLEQATTLASIHELDVSMAMSEQLDTLAAGDPRLARGIEANQARAAGEFGPWTGFAGPLPDGLRERVDRGMSATSLQSWATCPTSHFFGRVLGIRELEDRASGDNIDARDKGTLVHGVLEQVFSKHLGKPDSPNIKPETPWTTADLAIALELLATEADALKARGLTGREVLWAAHLSRLRRALRAILATDSQLRAARGAWPIAVEAAFGRGGVEPLVIDLPSRGPVSFSGSIDRVDATEDGHLIVTDYKTGKAYGYDAIPELGKDKPDLDLIDRGRKLQLVLYALAAQAVSDLPEAQVEAYFWFVEKGDLHRGGVVDDVQVKRLRDVLDVVVGGIRDGVNPANPGAPQVFPRETWEACSYCPFDRVCPSTRLEQWRGMREHAAVRPYADIADPQDLQPTDGEGTRS
ncbi:MAG: PD-(D/E)XK nuclease family protein [Dermatophilaceae bacterium]